MNYLGLLFFFLFNLLLCNFSLPTGTIELGEYRHTSEILWVRFQTTAINIAIKQDTNFFGFPVYIKDIFTLHFSLLTVQ